MNEEIELKLALPPEALTAFRQLPLIATAPLRGEPQLLSNTYYDTPDLDLMQAGIGLRTRQIGDDMLQTVKTAAPSTAGLTRRPEWEQPFHSRFDFTSVDDTNVREFLQRHYQRLTPLFTTRFHRETRIHAPDDGTHIEIMIDTGEIQTTRGTEPLCEVELELARGHHTALIQLAIQLAQTQPLLPHDTSKAQRGYALCLDRPVRPRPARPVQLCAELPSLEAFSRLALECTEQWQQNTWGIVYGDDPDFFHEAYSGLTRLDELFELFSDLLPSAFILHWQPIVREHLGLLTLPGHPGQTIPRPVAEIDARRITRLLKALEHCRDRQRRQVRHRLATCPGPGAAQLSLVAALHNLPTRTAPLLASFAARQLARRHEHLSSCWQAAHAGDIESLARVHHALQALKLAFEWLGTVVQSEGAPPIGHDWLHTLAELSDRSRYPAEVALMSHSTDPRKRSRTSETAHAYLRGWHEARCLELGPDLLHDTGRFLRQPAPWRA